MANKAILAGGSGFLGRALARELVRGGWQVVVLTRTPQEPGDVAWDATTLGPWADELEGAAAVVNFTGRSVNCIHTPENKRLILESRVNSVRVLGAAVARCHRPPPVWVQCATLALYGNAGDRVCDEQAPLADDFSAQVSRQWEAAFAAVAAPGLRQVVLRIGIVLGPGGGGLTPLAKLARRFLGGTVGNGRQYFSWLHLADMNGIILRALSQPEMAGAYNACAPNPVTNAEFMRALRHAVGRPWSPPAPEWAVRFGAHYFMRTDADLALTGRRCVPRRLLEEGYQFQFPELGPALRDALAE